MRAMRLKTMLWLIGVNLYISAFTFGGGYVVIPMIRKFHVTGKNLFSENELMDMAAVAQSSPGAIAVNLTVLAGYRVAGLAGAAVSCLAAVTPPIAVLAVVAVFYEAFRDSGTVAAILLGMQAGVAALIADLVVDMYRLLAKQRNPLPMLMAPAAFVASAVFDLNVALILAAAATLAAAKSLRPGKEGNANDMGTSG